MGGGRYRTELVGIKVSTDELEAQSTEWCETNLAPASSLHTHMDYHSHFRGKAALPFVKGIVDKPATLYASQHKIIATKARDKLIFCCIKQLVD